MPRKRITLTLDEDLVDEARALVGPRKLSEYVTQALRQQLQGDRLDEFLAEAAKEHGPIDPDVMDEVRRTWP